MKSQFQINENLLDRIISVAYGDANFFDKIRINLLAARNNEVKRLLSEYRITAKAIHSLEQDECPVEILDKVKNKTVEENDLFSPITKFLYTLLYKPAMTAAVILILISGTMFYILFNNMDTNDKYSEAQVRLAEKQVKQSLVLVNKIFYRTANKVEYDILKEQVAKPVQEGISTINDLFKGG